MLQIRDLWSWVGIIDRAAYSIWGILLFAIKYNLDRTISSFYFDLRWTFADYFFQFDKISVLAIAPEEYPFYLTLLLVSIPFIYVGTLLTVKRLRSTQLPTWLVLFFFVPILNMLLFIILSIIPAKEFQNPPSESNRSTISRWIPTSKIGSASMAIGVVCLLGILLLLFSVSFLGEYGWGLFVGIPFFIGLGSVLLYGYHEQRSFGQAMGVSVLSVLLFSLLLFILAVEGLICLLMASPIGIILACFGGTIGYFSQRASKNQIHTVFLFVFLAIPIFMGFESTNENDPPLIQNTSSIIIDATPQEVWQEVVAFRPIPEPTEALFQTGIAYPIKAEIKGVGVGAIRYCIFTTGSFVEPIEVWDEPRLLAFSVAEQPEPMRELSPYKDLNLPHLDGYFTSKRGQFLLTELPNGKTKLEGTTWYQQNIWPTAYWRVWSDTIIHAIHMRVLEHIKEQVEAK